MGKPPHGAQLDLFPIAVKDLDGAVVATPRGGVREVAGHIDRVEAAAPILACPREGERDFSLRPVKVDHDSLLLPCASSVVVARFHAHPRSPNAAEDLHPYVAGIQP
nr:hypothetical protein [Candidatus Freyrarchaeum guaymaensis]